MQDPASLLWAIAAGAVTLFIFIGARRYKHIFAPPRGRFLLIGAWGIAISALFVGFDLHAPFAVTMAALTIGPSLAVASTMAYRDASRESHGLPPGPPELPEQLGLRGRVVASALAGVAAFFGISTFNGESLDGISTTLGSALFFGWLSVAAITGRVPASLRRYVRGGWLGTRTSAGANAVTKHPQ